MHIINIVQQKIMQLTKKNTKKVGSGSVFSVDDNASSPEEAVNVGSAPKIQVSTAWMLQEVDGYAQDQKKMKEAGNKILQNLRQIRLDLLAGEWSAQNIRDLKDELKNTKLELQFPQLQSVIEDIKLRAEVELAKFEMSEEEKWPY